MKNKLKLIFFMIILQSGFPAFSDTEKQLNIISRADVNTFLRTLITDLLIEKKKRLEELQKKQTQRYQEWKGVSSISKKIENLKKIAIDKTDSAKNHEFERIVGIKVSKYGSISDIKNTLEQGERVGDALESHLAVIKKQMRRLDSLPTHADSQRNDKIRELKKDIKSIKQIFKRLGEIDHGELSQDEIDHGELSQDEIDHGELSQDEIDHGELSQDEIDHSELSQDEIDHGELSQDKIDHGELSQDEIDHSELSQDEIDHGELSQNEIDQAARDKQRDTKLQETKPERNVPIFKRFKRSIPTIRNHIKGQNYITSDF